MPLKAGATVVVHNQYSAFNGTVGRVVAVRPFDVMVRVVDHSRPMSRTITFPFGRGELVVVA